MSTFDRSQFKATSVDTLKSEEEKVKELTGYQGGDRVNYLKLTAGKNKVRIYPAHPGTKSFCQPRTVHFLELESKDKDGHKLDSDGKKCSETGKPVEIKRRPVFNAKVHGKFPEGVAPMDLIDEYISRVFAKAHAEIQDDETRKKYLSPVTFWKTGITARTKWISYADLYDNNNVPSFGRLELPSTVKDKMNEISANQDTEGLLVTDPFSHPDTGRVLFITYDPNESDAKKKYTAAIDFIKSTPLSDERLSQLMEQDSLEKMFQGVYGHKDLMMALEGLKRFDDKSVHALAQLGFNQGYQIFAEDEFLDLCEKMDSYFPKEAETFTQAAQQNSFVDGPQADEAQQNPVMQATPAEDIPLEQMNLDQLAKYIHTNGLSITILPDDAPEDVVLAIKDELGATAGESTTAAAETTTQQPAQQEEPAPTRERGQRTSELN